MSSAVVIRNNDVRKWFEGDELCTGYRNDAEMVFGTSFLEPGKQGAVDTGHRIGKEIFYCAYGKAILVVSEEEWIDMAAGDAVIVPATKSHRLINRSDEPVLLVWALAPVDEPA
jgi:oxalate decarboxylase/phosphoglucose isomerase-like protein (cupin superfamily)